MGWFEPLYAEGAGNPSFIPWADMKPNPNLTTWFDTHGLQATRGKALVVGCGLGDDAEYLAGKGFRVTAFDISPTAIDWCQQRFPESAVSYEVDDLFLPPTAWRRAFDFVLEAYTLQVLPADLRPAVVRQIGEFVARDGTLLVIARGREECDDPGTMPWPLTRPELLEFNSVGLTTVDFDDYVEDEVPPVRRFRVAYRSMEQ
jgi:SAM-dependent methyltransferase